MPDGRSPLIFASDEDDAAVVAALVSAPGIAVNAADEDGWTVLHIKTFHSSNARTDLVAALLTCPTIDVNARTTKDYEGTPAATTPLGIARRKGLSHRRVALLLQKRGGVE